MFSRSLLQRRVAAPVAAATILGGGAILYPKNIAYAEAPPSEARPARRSIYDDSTATPSEPTADVPSLPPPVPAGQPTPTDQLAIQVRAARLFLYDKSLATETYLNELLSRALNLESAFTNTVASLAPSKESGERVLPGGIYVIVSAMAGSIISRNRNILLRTVTPLGVGIAAAWTLLPVTTRNVADFTWEYEKKVPAIADTHLKIRDNFEYGYGMAIAHSHMARGMLEDKIGQGREIVESWVSKGK